MERQLLYEKDDVTLYRIKESDSDILVKTLHNENPNAHDLASFYSEYAILENEQIEGVRNVISRSKESGFYAYRLEYLDGKALSSHIDEQPFDPLEFTQIAIEMASILHRVHDRGIIHRDIKPANFIISEDRQKAILIDFGLATRYDIKAPFLASPEKIVGSLPYISPEQTGRMNRTLDYRSDLYSLGATFYKMVTGSPPFHSDDVLEIIHAHIARTPVSPTRKNPSVPDAISGIILKLLKKNAEERYQSATGLRYDLEQCLFELQNKGEVAFFHPGLRDRPIYLTIPEKLYGREPELERLIKIFEQSEHGSRELVLIKGYAGVGKSALVQQISASLHMRRAMVLQGKFDHLQKNIPYSGILQAINSLVEIILREDAAGLKKWKEQLLEAVGNLGRVLTDLIPDLRKIIGDMPELPALDPVESHNRLLYVMGRFARVVATSEHPLLIFIDDIQWADNASLELFQSIVTDSKITHLMWICAYRDNEVGETHPFFRSLEEISKKFTRISTITLSPLSLQDIQTMCAQTMESPESEIVELAEMIYSRTRGNIFFARELFKTLYNEGLIRYDRENEKWIQDLEQIRHIPITENVIDLLARKVNELPRETQHLLQIASCVGSRFDLTILQIVTEQPIVEIARSLEIAIQSGIILPEQDEFKYATFLDEGNAFEKMVCLFIHDRLQEAIYSFMNEDEKQIAHLRIGRFMLRSMIDEDLNERLLEVVNQLNAGILRISDKDEKIALANLNLEAGRRAKLSAAYEPAFLYFQKGLFLLDDENWKEDYSLTLALHNACAESAYLSGRFSEVEPLTAKIIQEARSENEKLDAYLVLVMTAMGQGNLPEVLRHGLAGLRIVGVHFPSKPLLPHIIFSLLSTKKALLGKTIESILDLPEMTDPSMIWAIRIMQKMTPAAFRAGSNLFPLLVFKMVRLSLRYGNTPPSIFSYAAYGISLCGVLGDIENGYRFGQLSNQMVHKLKDGKSFHPHAVFVFNNFIRHWKVPIASYIDDFMDGYQIGLETGYLFEAAWLAHHRALWAFFLGRELSLLERQLLDTFDIYYADDAAFTMARMLRQVVANLRGESQETTLIKGEFFDETTMAPLAPTEATHYHLKKMLLHYLFSETEEALNHVEKCERILDALTSMPGYSIFFLLSGLIRLRAYRNGFQSRTHLTKSKAAIKLLKKWARQLPATHLHRLYLLKAELAWTRGEWQEARESFDRAMDAFQAIEQNSSTMEEALLYEEAAEFYHSIDRKVFARTIAQHAMATFDRWGALAKARQLARKFSGLQIAGIRSHRITRGIDDTSVHTFSTTETSSSSSGAVNDMDYLTIMKGTQVISEALDLETILSKLLLFALENAGADRATFMIHDLETGHLQVRAVGTVEENENVTLVQIPLEEYNELPRSVIHYVVRSEKPLVMEDAITDRNYNSDPYIADKRVHSVLCMRIVHQGKSVGVLYLENSMNKGVFNAKRMELLNILTAQAAISIHNANLYESIRESYKKEKELKDAYQSFVPEQFLNLLGKRSIVEIAPGDCVETNMTILFSDIRSFTTLSEMMKPHETFRFLNSYLSRMEPAISTHNGFIDKYIGDAIMALFTRSPDDAIQAGLHMLEALRKFSREQNLAGIDEIRMGIGINSGRLMLGTIGNRDRMEGTVISDAVNVASRLENACKRYNASMLMAESTYLTLENKNIVEIRELDRVRFKGKTNPIMIIEILNAETPERRDIKKELLTLFQKGRALFYDNRISEAASIFADLHEKDPLDPVYSLYADRCRTSMGTN